MLEWEAVTLAFAQWIVAEKRRSSPNKLYVLGVNGSVGQGKTYFSQALVSVLNTLLTAEEGRAITRSLDDYYLTHAERYRPEFLARGYNPTGISNRGPAGTHDLVLLKENISALEQSQSGQRYHMPIFDKQTDDRSPETYIVENKIGVFILEGWFIGCRTKIDVEKANPGLKKSVAMALQDYTPLFKRIEKIIAFEPWSNFLDIVAQRVSQEEASSIKTGKPGMTRQQVQRFVGYFYEDSWQRGVTSPVAARDTVAFWLDADLDHRFLSVKPRILWG